MMMMMMMVVMVVDVILPFVSKFGSARLGWGPCGWLFLNEV